MHRELEFIFTFEYCLLEQQQTYEIKVIDTFIIYILTVQCMRTNKNINKAISKMTIKIYV